MIYIPLNSKLITVSALILLSFGFFCMPAGVAIADHECSTCCSNSSNGYGQGSYAYYQSGYYAQSTYYTQATYYLQGGYWPPVSQATITADPKIVRYGEQSTITWNGGNASSCSVLGAGLNSTAISGSFIVNAVTGAATYTIRCMLGPNMSEGSTTIEVTPGIDET